MKLSESIQQLRTNIDTLSKSTYPDLVNLDKQLDELKKHSNTMSDYWLGSWVKNQEFYKDFLNSSQQNTQVSYEQLYDFICKKADVDLNTIHDSVKSILKEYKETNDNLITELSIIKSKTQFSEQLEILEKLANYEWGFTSSFIIKTQRPKTTIVDYSTAENLMSKGLKTPPHKTFDANILSLASEISSIREYVKLSKRLLREIELLLNAENDEFIGLENPINNLNLIFDNFHDVARLLINRHANRETIKINDEYDVQDLLRSLLKIFFDDSRPEEFTPSYAGRNTRIDFLLKKEKIIIEVKKTRETLKDKELGDELLQDIARYRNHPDCNTLFCFVYDPQGFVSNPRGLENDLASESNDKMQVLISIRP